MGAVQAGVQVTPAAVLDYMLDEVLTDESKWTQKKAARRADGTEVTSGHPEAVKFCIMGAACRSLEVLKNRESGWAEGEWAVHEDIVRAIEDSLPRGFFRGGDATFGPIPAFNDDPHTTFEDVRLLVKRARELVED